MVKDEKNYAGLSKEGTEFSASYSENNVPYPGKTQNPSQNLGQQDDQNLDMTPSQSYRKGADVGNAASEGYTTPQTAKKPERFNPYPNTKPNPNPTTPASR